MPAFSTKTVLCCLYATCNMPHCRPYAVRTACSISGRAISQLANINCGACGTSAPHLAKLNIITCHFCLASTHSGRVLRVLFSASFLSFVSLLLLQLHVASISAEDSSDILSLFVSCCVLFLSGPSESSLQSLRNKIHSIMKACELTCGL